MSLLALGACAPRDDAGSGAAALAESVEIVARGNEPSWSVTISHNGIVFREPENIDGIAFPYLRPKVQRGRRIFRSTRPDSAALSIEVAIEEKPCSDGMSDQAYRFAATGRLGKRALEGCAVEREAGARGLDPRWLLDAKYPVEYARNGAAQLLNGVFDSGDSLDRVLVRLRRTAEGELDGDGRPDAAVVLATNAGGSGTFVSVVAVLNRWGRPVPTGELVLGDRTPVDSLYIEDGEVVVHFTDHGPDDPMCCPTVKVIRRFHLQGGRLTEP